MVISVTLWNAKKAKPNCTAVRCGENSAYRRGEVQRPRAFLYGDLYCIVASSCCRGIVASDRSAPEAHSTLSHHQCVFHRHPSFIYLFQAVIIESGWKVVDTLNTILVEAKQRVELKIVDEARKEVTVRELRHNVFDSIVFIPTTSS